ncbi:MAG: hypothetical protein ACK4KW_07730 [Gemmobacter sp.]
MAAALAVASWRIGYPALWVDEHVSLAFTQESWRDLAGRLWSVDTHRPVYYGLLKAWIEAVGTDRALMRLLGAVLAALAVGAVWAIGRVLGGARVGLLAAALSVCSPMAVAQARDLRMYPLSTLAILVAILAIALILRRGPTRGRWILFAVAAALAFHAQAVGVLLVPVAGSVVVGLAVSGLVPRVLVGQFLMAAALWLLLILPGLVPMVAHTRDTLADFWIPEPSPGWVWSQIAGAYPYPAVAKPFVLAALVGGFVALWRADRRAFWLLLAMVAGMPLLLWVLSYLRPVLIVRVFVWTTLVAAVVMAFGLAALRPVLRHAALAGLVGLQLVALRPLYPAERQFTDLDRLAPALRGFDTARDVMILELAAFEPNLRWNHPTLRAADLRTFSHGDRRDPFAALLWSDHRNRSEAAGMPLGTGRVWLISETEPMFPVPESDSVVPALDAIRARARPVHRESHGRVALEILEPDA